MIEEGERVIVEANKRDFGISLGEFDEVWATDAFVHVERMSDTGFWIGIDEPGKPRLMINTGVHRGVWFFNVYEDSMDGKSFGVQRPRRAKIPTEVSKARGKDNGKAANPKREDRILAAAKAEGR